MTDITYTGEVGNDPRGVTTRDLNGHLDERPAPALFLFGSEQIDEMVDHVRRQAAQQLETRLRIRGLVEDLGEVGHYLHLHRLVQGLVGGSLGGVGQRIRV